MMEHGARVQRTHLLLAGLRLEHVQRPAELFAVEFRQDAPESRALGVDRLRRWRPLLLVGHRADLLLLLVLRGLC